MGFILCIHKSVILSSSLSVPGLQLHCNLFIENSRKTQMQTTQQTLVTRNTMGNSHDGDLHLQICDSSSIFHNKKTFKFEIVNFLSVWTNMQAWKFRK